MELTTTKYKNTEVGLIPEDWNVISMKEITNLMTNGFVGTAKTHYTESSDGILYIQGFNVEENSFNFHGIKRVTKEFHAKNSKSNLREGDLLTVQTGDVGLTTIVTAELAGSNCHALIISRFKKDKAYPWFYTQYFNSGIGRNRLKELETGTTMKHINVGDLIHWEVPLPPTIEEQKAIAKVLSDTDALIQAIEKKIAKKKLIKKGVMQRVLTPKENWEEKTLGEIAEFFKGKGLPKSAIEESGKYKCIHYGELFTTYKEIITNVISRTNTNNDLTFSRVNDVLMPTSDVTPNGLATASSINEDNVILGGDVLVIRIPKNIVLGSFLSYSITQNREQVMQLVTGTTVYHLYGSDMAKFTLKYPKIDEQFEAVRILSDIEKEIDSLRQKLSKYQFAKQGMMQQLLTGKIRLA